MTAQEYLKNLINKYRQKLVGERTKISDLDELDTFWKAPPTKDRKYKYITEDGICTLCGDHFSNHDH